MRGKSWLGSLRRKTAAIPGAIVFVRILKNVYWGLRQRLVRRPYDIDGTAHSQMDFQSSVAYIQAVFDDYLRLGGGREALFEGKRVLEIGPGDSLGVALLLVGAGAAKVVCLDRFYSERDHEKESRILRALVQGSAPEGRNRMLSSLDPNGRVIGDRIRYLSDVPIERAAEPIGGARFDIIVSRSVLEHVYDLEETYGSCRRLLSTGGMMIHKVDLTNHSDVERHPLQFLKYSNLLWAFMSSNISRINRGRWPEHRASLERNRFMIERFEVTGRYTRDQVHTIRPRLASRFRAASDDDLAIAGFFVVCRTI